MQICVYPGSFDPFTKGHMDIAKRAAAMFGEVCIAVLNNSAKGYMYTLDRRREMIELAMGGVGNVKTAAFEGLLTDLMRDLEINTVVRGLRSGDDLEIEQQMATVNAKLLPGAETVFLLARPETRFISSTIVRELISFGADVGEYVPEEILNVIHGR